jgi:hypothetical protein
VGLVARGRALPDVERAISERRGQADALAAKLAEPVDLELDRKSLRAGLTMIRTFRNGSRIINDPKNDFIIFEPSRTTGPLATEHDPALGWRCGRSASSGSSSSRWRADRSSRALPTWAGW